MRRGRGDRDEFAGVRRGAPRARTPATSTTPPTTSPPPSWACSAPTATCAMAWIARVLLCSPRAWLVIGVVASRTRLVRRPGAAAARASWLGVDASVAGAGIHPRAAAAGPVAAARRARGAADRDPRGADVVPSWTHLAVVLGAWLVFVLVVRLLVGRRSPWPVIAAVGGVVVLRCIVTLLALSFTGPGGYWFAFWTEPTRRTVYIAFAFALFVWAVRRGRLGARRALGRRRARAPCSPASGAGSRYPPRSSRRRPRAGAHRVERRDGTAAVGSGAHPRHHRVSRHPGGRGRGSPRASAP